MDMDIDWCLTCNKRVEGTSLYCSLKCQNGAGPSNYRQRSLASLSEEQESSNDARLEVAEEYEEDYLEGFSDYDDQISNIEAVSKTTWAGRGSAGIRAWASEIPLGAHPEVQQEFVPPTTPASSDDSSSVSSTSSTNSTYRAPNLVRPSRPVPPSLTMSKPDFSTTTPPRPILNLQTHLAAISLNRSPGSTARTSIISEDSLPTPASTHSIHPMAFSPLPGRPFPSISDARACDLAACTQLNSPTTPSRPQKGDKYLVQSRCLPIAPRIASSPSSLDDGFESSPPWWVTNSMIARHATRVATQHVRSSVRKDTSSPSEALRGRRSSRVAA